MIIITKLLKNWAENEWDKADAGHEYDRLYNTLWTLHENSLMSLERLTVEVDKLNKAFDKFTTREV